MRRDRTTLRSVGEGHWNAPRRRQRVGGRGVLVSVVAFAALLATPAAVADPPGLIGVPGNQTLEATSSAGAVFSSPDPVASNGSPVECVPPSSTTFPLGTTTVTCTATDDPGNTASFDVTVEDTTAPDLSVPGSVTVEATGPSGAAVSYSASASDIVDGSISPTCSPRPGARSASEPRPSSAPRPTRTETRTPTPSPSPSRTRRRRP